MSVMVMGRGARRGRRLRNDRARWSRRRTLAFILMANLIFWWGVALVVEFTRMLLRI
jgi:hypothetical protein